MDNLRVFSVLRQEGYLTVPLRSSQFNSFKLHSNKSAFLLNHIPGRTSKNVDGGPLVFLEGLNPYWERIRFYAAA